MNLPEECSILLDYNSSWIFLSMVTYSWKSTNQWKYDIFVLKNCVATLAYKTLLNNPSKFHYKLTHLTPMAAGNCSENIEILFFINRNPYDRKDLGNQSKP